MDSKVLLNDMVRKDIFDIINKIKNCHSNSLYDKLILDITMLYELANILQLDDILDVDNYSYKTFSFNPNKKEKNQKMFYTEGYEFNKQLTDNYLYLLNKYTDENFKYNVTEFSYKDSQMLVSDFLINFDKNIHKVFKNCVENNRFIYLENEEYNFNEGETYYGNYFKPYVLIEDFKSIFTSLTSVHEVGHLYDYSNLISKPNNYLREIYSHFMELVFGDYLMDNKIDYKNVKYNYLDNLEENLVDLSNLLKENLITKIDFRYKFSQIYSTLEYAYGMVLAFNFYDIYKNDKELGMHTINEFSKNKNDFNNPFDVIDKFKFNKEEIKQGKVFQKYLKNNL